MPTFVDLCTGCKWFLSPSIPLLLVFVFKGNCKLFAVVAVYNWFYPENNKGLYYNYYLEYVFSTNEPKLCILDFNACSGIIGACYW